MLQARIKKVLAGVELPKYHSNEAAGFDIAAGESVNIQPGEIKKIRTGLVIEAPEGHFLLLTCRSSLAMKKGLALANGVGTIDRDYSGPEDEVHIIVRNITQDVVGVSFGERLVQGIFLPVRQVEWLEVKEMDKQNRGGIGSTGGYNI
jgi:dUTP pyrophosphatase